MGTKPPPFLTNFSKSALVSDDQRGYFESKVVLLWRLQQCQDQLNCPHISPHRRCELCAPQITNYRLCFMPCVFSAILTRTRLSNYRAGSLLGCRSSLVGLSRRGRLRFLTAIQHNQPDHQETCQEKDCLKSFGFAIHFGLLSKSFAELNLVQTIYDTTKANLTSPI